MQSRLLPFFAVACLAAAFPSLAAQEPARRTPATARVELKNGRAWEGLIDARSTPQQLVLRFERGTLVLRRPIPWEEVRVAWLNGETIAPGELAKTYRPLATEMNPFAERERLPGEEASPSDRRPGEPPANGKPPLPPAKVISIACDALLANWDGDVEADGLVIHLQPLDALQEIVAASGTLEVELFTLQARTFHHASNSRGRSVEPIVRWSQAVNASDYRSRGAFIQLPFQAAHPEFDDSLGAFGLVHIRFSAPGSGVFEQSLDGVRIRPWSPLRDYLQMDTGYRFLPHEGTGRGKASWFTDDQ